MAELAVIQGDITSVTADVIVNAANSSLMGGGGVDGAIHRAGGPSILAECQTIRAEHGPLETGGAVATTAGRLPARWVIHTVGPVWGSTSEHQAEVLLEQCYTNSLDLAVTLGAKSIAFPNISTGVYHFPKPLAARIAVAAVQKAPAADRLDSITFVCFDDENLELYQGILAAET